MVRFGFRVHSLTDERPIRQDRGYGIHAMTGRGSISSRGAGRRITTDAGLRSTDIGRGRPVREFVVQPMRPRWLLFSELGGVRRLGWD